MFGLRRHHHRRWAVWVASFAILINAFAPAWAQAWFQSQAGAASWVEVCSTSTKLFSAKADPTPAKSDMKAAHCPFCLPHAGSFALLPSAAPAVVSLQQHDTHPALFYSAPRPLFAWTQAQPRAPPAAC